MLKKLYDCLLHCFPCIRQTKIREKGIELTTPIDVIPEL